MFDLALVGSSFQPKQLIEIPPLPLGVRHPDGSPRTLKHLKGVLARNN